MIDVSKCFSRRNQLEFGSEQVVVTAQVDGTGAG